MFYEVTKVLARKVFGTECSQREMNELEDTVENLRVNLKAFELEYHSRLPLHKRFYYANKNVIKTTILASGFFIGGAFLVASAIGIPLSEALSLALENLIGLFI